MALANGDGGNRGAGVVGSGGSHVTACVNSRNPHGHNRECPCGWWLRERASQVVPYLPPEPAQLHQFFKDS